MYRFLLSLAIKSVIDSFVLFLGRFSDVGNDVLLTAASRDGDFCRMALNEGRTVIALEPDQLMMKAAPENVSAWVAHAAKNGMWARVPTGPIVAVGWSKLPVMVPPSNVPVVTVREIDDPKVAATGTRRTSSSLTNLRSLLLLLRCTAWRFG